MHLLSGVDESGPSKEVVDVGGRRRGMQNVALDSGHAYVINEPAPDAVARQPSTRSSRPPGLSTRCISATAVLVQVVVKAVAAQVTTSNTPSANGRRSLSPCTAVTCSASARQRDRPLTSIAETRSTPHTLLCGRHALIRAAKSPVPQPTSSTASTAGQLRPSSDPQQ